MEINENLQNLTILFQTVIVSNIRRHFLWTCNPLRNEKGNRIIQKLEYVFFMSHLFFCCHLYILFRNFSISMFLLKHLDR